LPCHAVQFPPYQTDIDIKDVPKLHEEALDIWSEFKIDAENAKVNDAIISANSVPQGGFIQSSSGHNFIFTKDQSGEWHELSNGPKKEGEKVNNK
jgi:hypothetical protein